MTVSIGVTVFQKDDTPESAVERADKALYKAKRNGKNCAVGRKG
jgi:diguanylate cyclase